jgi:hypothetical protein
MSDQPIAKTSTYTGQRNTVRRAFFILKVGWVRPKRGCILMLHCPDDMSLESDGGMILTGENRRTRRKTCPSTILSTTKPTWIDPGTNPCLRGERPATNDLRNGTAQDVPYRDSNPVSQRPRPTSQTARPLGPA